MSHTSKLRRLLVQSLLRFQLLRVVDAIPSESRKRLAMFQEREKQRRQSDISPLIAYGYGRLKMTSDSVKNN